MNERPDTEQIKAQLAAEIARLIGEHKLTDAEAGERLGVSPADIAGLRAGEQARFSIDALVGLLNVFDQHVTVAVAPTSSEATDGRPIWEQIAEIVAQVPPEEWEKLPADLAANHDHYLYGTPKRY